MKKVILIFLMLVLVSTTVLSETIYETKNTYPVASGITRTTIRRFCESGFQYINVVEADLKNKYVSADIILPEKGVSSLQSPLSMANKNNTSVLINGDFFSTSKSGGSAIGGVIKNNEILSSGGDDKMASVGIFDGEIIMDYFKITAKITAQNGESIEIKHINKYDPLDAICLYTGDFYKTTPGAINNILEVLVVDDIITQINSKGEVIEIPDNGYVLRVLPEFNTFIPDNLKVGEKLLLEINANFDKEKAKALMGGGTLLVKEGEKSKITHNISGKNPRTAIGVDKEGKKLYLVTVDGRNSYSEGMTLSELSDFLLEIGVYNAINLDGGGSTAMIVNSFGSQNAVHSLSSSYLRPVANAFGVFSKAPKGEIKTFEIKGEDVFNGFSAEIEIFNIKDSYENPSNEKIKPIFSVDENFGYFKDNIFYPTKSGKNVEISATYKNHTAKTYIDILELNEIKAFPSHFNKGDEVKFDLYGYTKENQKLLIKDYTIKGDSVSAGGKTTKLLFSDIDEAFSSKKEITTYPKDTSKGSASVDKNITLDGNGSLKVDFDFTHSSSDTKAVYINVGSDVKGKYGYLSLYSNKNHQWLRCEFSDEEGNLINSTIKDDIDFSGWKTLSFEIPEKAVKLEKIYLVQNSYKNKNKGSIYLDSLSYSNEYIAGFELLEDTAEKTTKNGNFVVFGGITSVENLLTTALKNTLENAIIKEGAYFNFSLEGLTFDRVQVNKINSHASSTDETSIYIRLNNSDGYISKAQFVKFKNDLTTNKKNIFIFMNEDINLMKSKEELEIFKTLMKEACHEKNIFVFYPSDSNSIYTEDGINYIKVMGIKDSSAKGILHFPENFGYYSVKNGENPKVYFKSIFQ